MTKKKGSTPTAKLTFPYSVELYTDPRWEIGTALKHPSCVNGMVRVERYRVTVEKIEEPVEVLRARLVKLWRESERNSHYWQPMREAAKRLLGIDDADARELLRIDDQGIDHKERR